MSTGSVISWLSTLKMELILNAFFFVLIISFRTLHVALAFDLEASIFYREFLLIHASQNGICGADKCRFCGIKFLISTLFGRKTVVCC